MTLGPKLPKPSRRGQSGRTTRMLKDAIAEADSGKVVVVIGHSLAFAKHMQRMTRDLMDSREHGSMRFLSVWDPRLVWDRLGRPSVRGIDASYFVDHAVADHDKPRRW